MYFLSLFMAPLAFLISGRTLHALLSLKLYLMAIVGVLFGFAPALIFWFVGVLHAHYVLGTPKPQPETAAEA